MFEQWDIEFSRCVQAKQRLSVTVALPYVSIHSSFDVRIIEVVVIPHSVVEGQSMRGLNMHQRANDHVGLDVLFYS